MAADRQAALDETALADPTFDETTPYGTLALDTRTLTTTLDRAVDELALVAELDHPEYLCSSHILVDTAAEAEEIVTLLDEGADFATLAIERSGDGSAAIGGDLGYGPTIGYVSEFSDGAREAGSGNISSPVLPIWLACHLGPHDWRAHPGEPPRNDRGPGPASARQFRTAGATASPTTSAPRSSTQRGSGSLPGTRSTSDSVCGIPPFASSPRPARSTAEPGRVGSTHHRGARSGWPRADHPAGHGAAGCDPGR